MENNWTVYQHIFPDGTKYIGITSRKPKIRWGNNGIKYKGQKVYQIIQKYDWNTEIQHEILYTNLTLEEASKKEQELIEKERNSNPWVIRYNIDAGGYKQLHFGKKVYQYDFSTGNFIQEFINSKIAAKQISNTEDNGYNILKCCNLQRKSACGFLWSYYKNTNYFLLNDKIKYIKQLTSDGQILNTFINAAEAERITGISKVCICNCLRKEQTLAGGYKWEKSHS